MVTCGLRRKGGNVRVVGRANPGPLLSVDQIRSVVSDGDSAPIDMAENINPKLP
jgi:hypothetical protein